MYDILAVEDNAMNVALLHAILDRVGAYTLHNAMTLEMARRLLRERPFHLVLLDWRMPDGSGLDLAREIRTNEQTATIPIIMISASVLPSEQATALEAGCNLFLAKPITSAVLMQAVSSMLPPATT